MKPEAKYIETSYKNAFKKKRLEVLSAQMRAEAERLYNSGVIAGRVPASVVQKIIDFADNLDDINK